MTYNPKSNDPATVSNDGYMTQAQASKLDGIAAGAEVNVNADWSAGSGDAQILNKPTLGGAAALNVGTTGERLRQETTPDLPTPAPLRPMLPVIKAAERTQSSWTNLQPRPT